VLHFWLGPIDENSFEEEFSRRTRSVKESVVFYLKGEKHKSSFFKEMNADKILTISVIAAAFVSVSLSMFAFIRKEDQKVLFTSVGMACLTILFQYQAIAIAGLVLIGGTAFILTKTLKIEIKK
jgi:hypothetical protein